MVWFGFRPRDAPSPHPHCNSPSGGVQNVSPLSPSENEREAPIHWDRLRRGRGQPLEPRRDDDHPHGYGPHRSPGEIAGPAGSPLRLPAGHGIRVPFPRALVPSRVSRIPSYPWEQMAMSSGSPWPMSRGQPWPSHRLSSNAARPRIEPAGREPHDAAVLRVMSS